jgi:coiled-coil domain-containing protein 130
MSSLAAVQADGYYRPPEHANASHNALHGRKTFDSRAESARKRGGGQVVRFELPFHLLCSACGTKIGKGTRFNAEKARKGWHHSTPVWRFCMHTVCCSNPLIICTDPANRGFAVESGASRKTILADADPSRSESLQVEDPGTARKQRAERDALDRAERDAADKQIARAANERIQSLKHCQDSVWEDDYTTNKAMRRVMRQQRKDEQARDAYRRQLGLPESFTLKKLSSDDARKARAASLAASSTREVSKRKRDDIRQQSIFAGTEDESSSTGRWEPEKIRAARKRARVEAGVESVRSNSR